MHTERTKNYGIERGKLWLITTYFSLTSSNELQYCLKIDCTVSKKNTI